MKKVKQLVRTLFGRQWWWVTLLVLMLMAVLARLGIWQLRSAAAAPGEQFGVSSNPGSITIGSGQGSSFPDDVESLKNRQVLTAGVFDFDHQVMLKVQNWQGKAGAHLITPLVFDDGEQAVLVDRGWIPEADNNPDSRAKYDVPGLVTVEGFVVLSETLTGRPQDEPAEPQDQWYRVDVAAIQRQMPYELLPFYVVQAPDDNTQPPYREEPQLDLSEGNHLSYAVQWFIFSLGLGIGYVLFVNKQLKESKSS